jgi:hypothetical protein
MGSFRKSRKNLTGNLSVKSGTSQRPRLTINNQNDDDKSGSIRFIKNSSSPSGSGDFTGDDLGRIDFYGKNSADEDTAYAQIKAVSTSVTDGAENGSLVFTTTQGLSGFGAFQIEVARGNPMVGTTPSFGFGFRRPVYIVSGVTSFDLEAKHSGMVLHLNDAFSSGITINLPADNTLDAGMFFTIFIGTSVTGTFKIATDADGDTMFGAIHAISANGSADVFQAGASDDNIVADADTKGRLEGSVYHCTLTGNQKWLIEANVTATGTPASAWSTS